MKLTQANLTTSTALVLGLALGAYTAAAAQKPARPSMPAAHPSGPAATHDKTTFQGIATKLNTTPDALESAYQTAKAANPKLTRGQFVAANVLAQNLGSKNPAITTDAILAGLKGGKSIGQTLQSLGLSASEAKEAERAADREVREAHKPAS